MKRIFFTKKNYKLQFILKLILSLNLGENPLVAPWNPPYAKIYYNKDITKKEMKNNINTRRIDKNRQGLRYMLCGPAADAQAYFIFQ